MSEPTAWIRQDGVIAFYEKKEIDSQGYKWFPLYLHPAKTLTDEEIEVLWEKHCPFDLTAGIKFARAILRKTQEK
jgi:hypothetical protein